MTETLFTDKKGKPIAFLKTPSEILAIDYFFSLLKRSKGILEGGQDAPAAALWSTADIYGVRIYKVKEWELRRAIGQTKLRINGRG